MTTKDEVRDWEKEFDEKWGNAIGNLALARPAIKDFIRSLLAKKREEMTELMKENGVATEEIEQYLTILTN